MTKMIVDALRRTGTATSPTRQIIAVQGDDERVLSTPITKIEWGMEFRKAGKTTPVEQYAFKVRNTTYERFADATAAVMKIHHIEVAPNEVEDAQIYVKKATDILHGKETIRVLAEVPENAKPAIAA